MLFNSLPFLFGFLPVTLAGYFFIGRRNWPLAGAWLSAASLFFYGWWNAGFLWLLIGSVVFNYSAGIVIARASRQSRGGGRALLAIAVAANLLLLAYYKYAGFFAAIAADLFGAGQNIGTIILPLGISFFTFTQIAFLVDVRRGAVTRFNFIHYLLFVTYFPHLIAGPILHHSQMIPQFADPRNAAVNWTNMYVGFTVFAIGLAKKVLLADNLAAIATPIFSAAHAGAQPAFVEAWAGALAYTLQLYFDFSGYCDMAIGISLCFNIRLPINFNSPYKAANIIDFWRRWHMTLSAFLRDYLYIPLGGNRKGEAGRIVNVLATMLLGGLWHGAGWTFVVWGGLHGLYLVINHGFQALRAKAGWRSGRFGLAGAALATLTTFVFVVIAWVFFRADSFAAASAMLHGMAGSNGLKAPAAFFTIGGLSGRYVVPLLVFGLAIVWLLPNTQQFVRALKPALETITAPTGFLARLEWRPQRWWTWGAFGILAALGILSLSPTAVSEFLYYQF